MKIRFLGINKIEITLRAATTTTELGWYIGLPRDCQLNAFLLMATQLHLKPVKPFSDTPRRGLCAEEK